MSAHPALELPIVVPARQGHPPRSVAALRTIMGQEWRMLAADSTLRIVVGVFVLAFGYGLANGLAWDRIQRRAIGEALAEQDNRLTALRRSFDSIPANAPPPAPFTADPRSPGLVGGSRGVQYAVLPPAPLAFTAVGQSDLYPSYLTVSSRSQLASPVTDEIENPVNLLTGRFDAAFALVYLLPLLVLALSYNLLSAEREQGTLALLLSQPVRLRVVLAGKIMVRGLVIGTLALVLLAAALLLAGIVLPDADTLQRIAAWMALVLAYAGFWLGLALLANLLGRGSVSNAMVLAGAWLLLVVVVPSLLNIGILAAHPVPSRVELIGRLREATNEANARGSQLLARYYEDHPELAPPGDSLNLDDFLTKAYSVQLSVDSIMRPLLQRYEQQLQAQQRSVDRYRYLSPAILIHGALSDLAGTGAARYRHFQRQVNEYHAAWQAFFIPRIFRRSPLTAADFDRLPPYRFEEEPTGALMNRVGPALLALAGMAAGLWMLALPMMRRYRVAG
jgi:ABC-2 type transport system permease protein